MNQIQNVGLDRLTLKYHGFTEKDLDRKFTIYTPKIQVSYIILKF